MNTVQVAVLPGGARPPAITPPASAPRRERIRVQVAAFAALGLYGILRWDTLLSGGAFARLFGLLMLSAALTVVGPLLARFSRWLAVAMFVLGLWAAFAIAGLPLDWVVHLRLAVSFRAIGDGLSALPQINVPYIGINEWVRVTLLLGAMILLLDAALVLTFVPRRLGLLRRAGAALPLIALAVIPATALRPRTPYVEGALLFGLVVTFVWGDRIESRRLGGVLAPCALAAVLGVGLAPALDGHRAWINYQRLAASLAPGGVESFNWTQGYGPLHWPHTGQAVLDVQASHRDYWKAENLDVFNGKGWVDARAPVAIPWRTGLSAAAVRRWSQTLQVTLEAMSTSRVIGSGSTTAAPSALPGGALAGTSSGTWVSSRRLVQGASYRVHVYSPHPSVAQLTSDKDGYPSSVAQSYLSMIVPVFPVPGAATSATGAAELEQVVFAPFDPRTTPVLESPTATSSLMASTPYARAYALAQRLKLEAATPYAYVRAVLAYLAHGYTYNQSPPASRYPLEDFLFVHKLGYCQHFAGAMALLLRMGGVPARVAVGFTSGTYDRPGHHWVVSDLNAHAWVEAWFPRYGWVRFDPTPSVDPALARTVSAKGSFVDSPASKRGGPGTHGLGGGAPGGARRAARATGRGSGVSALVIVPPTILALMLLLALLTRARSGEDPVGELSRAFVRSGRPLDMASTLSALEHRLSYSPEAAAYVRALRLAKYGRVPSAPARRQLRTGRRALRRALGTGLGPVGRARAWWALPPRWHWPQGGRRLDPAA
ncbi:MAG TPA: transglutaminaseTgpA domain-containing protein [Solirubrobacteraceae bacterium]|jgi:transglutaminase-like putative cysteine protease